MTIYMLSPGVEHSHEGILVTTPVMQRSSNEMSTPVYLSVKGKHKEN